MLPSLLAQYRGRYVALRDGLVVAVGETQVDAATEAYRQHPGALIYTRLVTDEPQPIPRIGSPRLARLEE